MGGGGVQIFCLECADEEVGFECLVSGGVSIFFMEWGFFGGGGRGGEKELTEFEIAVQSGVCSRAGICTRAMY